MEQRKKSPQIGAWASTSLVLGNMIGSGIFLLPASLAAYGAISIGGWILSSLGALMLAKIFSDLSKRIPQLGGPYIYTRVGFGEFPAFMVAWGYWVSILATNAAIAVAMLSYLTVFFPSLSSSKVLSITIGLAVIWLLSWVNSKGIKHAGWVQLITTILKVIPLFLVALVGLFFLNIEHFQPLNLSGSSNWAALAATGTLTLFAFLGIESATIPASGTADAAKTIPKATMLGTYLAMGVYILGSISVMGIIEPEVLQESQAPFADAAAILWGEWARKGVALGAIISTFGALNGWILLQGQIPLAAAKDHLFPQLFAKLNLHNSPARGIALSSVFVSILLIMSFTKGFVKAFEFMILLSTLAVLVPYVFSSLTHLKLSRQGKQAWTWLWGIGGLLFSIWAMIGSGWEVIAWGLLVFVVGIPFYLFWTQRSSL